MRPLSKIAILIGWFTVPVLANAQAFVAFESEHFRPLALSPDGSTLYAVNTPDNRLEILSIQDDELIPVQSVPVGLEPVAVSVRNVSEVWVVNHLSDSVSIVDVSLNPARVVRTLLVGDEPRDIVFGGGANSRAFVTTAHRGQNSPYRDPANPGELTTPGIGRADVWVFDTTGPGRALGGEPITIVTLFGDTPGPLAVTADGSTVYAAIFKSGNQTTTVPQGAVCPGGASAPPCTPTTGELEAPGGLPAPNENTAGVPMPISGLIVKHDGTAWRDELGRDWNTMIRFDLPDLDVFAIDAQANPPVETQAFAHVGTVLYGMAVNPATQRVYVANTEAINEVRFEGKRPPGSNVSTVHGHQHETRITVIDPGGGTVNARHLNKHIDYSVSPAPATVKARSLALPKGMVFSADGETLYLAAKGSAKIGVFATTEIANDSFVPDADDHITVSGGGPSGLALAESGQLLYAFTRFDNGISVIDVETKTEVSHVLLHNPEPASLVDGRPIHYDAALTSSNGEAACASCHVGGDKDELAWDLGDPDGDVVDDPNPVSGNGVANDVFHPMKGPMITQTLRGMATHGPMHWRADRSGAFDSGGQFDDEDAAFKQFNPAFVSLMGRESELTDAEMQAFTDFALQLTPPPNPIRALDDSLTAIQQTGSDFFFTFPSTNPPTCNGCHTFDRSLGFFGTNGTMGFAGGVELRKVPQLRNLYEKVGMFGRVQTSGVPSDNQHTGPQVRGYGFTHAGSTDTLVRFHRVPGFRFPGGDAQRAEVSQFLFAAESNLKPVVGQQVTLRRASNSDAEARVDLLDARAAAGDADLVVKAISGGVQRGWVRIPSGQYISDRASAQPVTLEQLRELAAAGRRVTFTAVPVGSGERIGIDRDDDDVLDGDDNCPATMNPDQADDNGDGFGNVCQALAIQGTGAGLTTSSNGALVWCLLLLPLLGWRRYSGTGRFSRSSRR